MIQSRNPRNFLRDALSWLSRTRSRWSTAAFPRRFDPRLTVALLTLWGILSAAAFGRAAELTLTAEQQAKVSNAERLSRQMEQLAGVGKFSEAITLAQQILSINTECFGVKSAKAAVAINSLGFLFQEKGD